MNNTTVSQESETFNYDFNSNRVSDKENSASIYDTESQRLLEDDFYNYSYDLNGNLIFKIFKTCAGRLGLASTS